MLDLAVLLCGYPLAFLLEFLAFLLLQTIFVTLKCVFNSGLTDVTKWRLGHSSRWPEIFRKMGDVSLCLVNRMSNTQPICLVAQFNKPVIFPPNRDGSFWRSPWKGWSDLPVRRIPLELWIVHCSKTWQSDKCPCGVLCLSCAPQVGFYSSWGTGMAREGSTSSVCRGKVNRVVLELVMIADEWNWKVALWQDTWAEPWLQ